MNVVFVEPFFPSNQRQFARALAEAGATVIGIGEYGVESFDDDLKGWLDHYERVSSVTDVDAMTRAVRWVQDKLWVDRLEATIEAHTMAAAQVREACTIPGTSVRTAWLCRDKPSMKEVLREAGVPTAASAAVSSAASAREFAERAGFPLILKPRSGAGASGTVRVDSVSELDDALGVFGGQGVESIAVEEFVEGHEGFYDTIAVDGHVAVDFVSHYYPNVLEAMRTRWISPQFVSTNRLDTAPEYGELREMGARVITALGIGTSATHMEWFFGPKGLKFSEIGCRPPGVGAWDLYSAGNEIDLEMRILRVSPEELRIFGYTEQQMLGKRATEFIVMQETAQRAIEQKVTGAKELKPFLRTFKRADGSAVPMILLDRHIKDKNGRVLGLRTAMTPAS